MSRRIPEDLVEEIRQSNDITEVVGEFVQLKKQGRNYFGLCPFHGESTPSFSVSPDKQIFHCFGCHKGGNVYRFIMEIEGLSFNQAVAKLAERIGKSISDEFLSQANESETVAPELQDILSAHEWLEKLYHHLLMHTKEGKQAYQYLVGRGFSESTLETFHIGYAPNTANFTARFLEKKGYHLHSMVKAGLLAQSEDGSYLDRFRGRVIFPIKNHQGKTVGFGGRDLTDHGPKYLNSPETELFQKGKLLYNFDQARSFIRKEKYAVLFEGYADVISAHQAGVTNGVATLGTALSDMQVKFLKRYVDTVMICYDSDQAGIEATQKAANLLKREGCQIKVAMLPDGMDPDDYIKVNGPKAFQEKIIQSSVTYVTFFMKYLKRSYHLKDEGDKIKYVEKVLNEIALLDKPLERDYHLRELSRDQDLSIEVLERELAFILRKSRHNHKDKEHSTGHNKNNTYTIAHDKRLLPAFQKAERILLAYMLQDLWVAEKVRDELGVNFNTSEHCVLLSHLYGYYEEGHEPNVSHFMEYVDDPKLKDLISELGMLSVKEELSTQELMDYLKVIRQERMSKNEIKGLKEKQHEAEKNQDHITAAKIAMQILELKKRAKR
ncbi:DNA primase [Bacillaceae bacterium S4-13-58]